MKKVIISTIALLNLVLVSSCTDFLTVDPVDKQVKESYYTSEESVLNNTASLYGLVWWDFTNRFMYQGGDMMSGDLYYTYAEEGQFFLNTVRPENLYSKQGWDGLFRVVSYANSIIDDMPGMAGANGVSEAVINEALGEAYLFRALAYYMLVEYWDNVPIVERPTDLITSGSSADMFLRCNTHSSVYRFICEDLDRAVANLPKTAKQAGRVTYYSALGLKAKVYLTRASYEGNAEYYATAKACAQEVITDGPALFGDYSTMFDVSADNCSESLIAIQDIVGGYGYGNSRPIEWGRRDGLTGVSCWGSGKGPTLSLQELFEEHPGDGRRQWVYMQQGDHYPLLNDYTYNIWYSEKADCSVWVDQLNFTRAHAKKYVINSNGGQDIGTGQDGANNLYLLRVADVYFVYAEACLAGDLNKTLTDATALGYVNAVLNRGKAGYTVSGLTYMDLIKERRREFALEGMNWFDIKRMAYLDEGTALEYLNTMYRDKMYKLDYVKIDAEIGGTHTNVDIANYGNKLDYYIRCWSSEINAEDMTDAGPNDNINTENRGAPIVFNKSNLYIAIPADATTNAPLLLEEPVDYYAEGDADADADADQETDQE